MVGKEIVESAAYSIVLPNPSQSPNRAAPPQQIVQPTKESIKEERKGEDKKTPILKFDRISQITYFERRGIL